MSVILTEKDKIDILKDMKVIVDSREKRNEHILEFLKSNGIPYEVRGMETGDYTCEFPNYPELELDGKFLVERKASLSEVAGNFTKNRSRFVRLFERIKPDQKMHMLIETATWKKIFNGTYRSELHPNSFKASILTFCIRYNCPIWFVEKKESPELIYKILHYEVKEYLRNIT